MEKREENNYYLKVGRAADLKKPFERKLYRFFELFPAILSFGTIFLVIVLSWKAPILIAFFIILFDIYWVLRSVYFIFHLRAGYKKMQKNREKNWLLKLDNLQFPISSLGVKSWREIYHLIILPMYNEPLQIVRESFKALLKSDYPKDKMLVVLACEDRNRDFVKSTAAAIKGEFGDKFYKFLVTWHPSGLQGEIAGKGSNETWAAKKAQEKFIDPLKFPYQIFLVSSMDIDTVVFPKFFCCLVWYYLTSKNPTRTSYQPIPFFINNIWEAPVISQVFSFSSTFWHTINQERPEKLITFSSHSMSFKALEDVGFKQTNVISDDSRIFWQCLLKYDGDYRVQPLYYPVSMDANVAKSFWQTMINIYKQQKRWAYGVGDIPYFLFGFLKNKKISFSRKFLFAREAIEGHWSWAVASILIFLLGWLPLALGGWQFKQALISYNLPKITSYLLTAAMLGLIVSIHLSILSLPIKPAQYSRSKYLVFVLGWFLIPFTMIFFTSLPALEAQARWMFGRYMSFWTTTKVRKS